MVIKNKTKTKFDIFHTSFISESQLYDEMYPEPSQTADFNFSQENNKSWEKCKRGTSRRFACKRCLRAPFTTTLAHIAVAERKTHHSLQWLIHEHMTPSSNFFFVFFFLLLLLKLSKIRHNLSGNTNFYLTNLVSK